ncbi:lysophospholipase L1-like esterase [Paucimonas lemoignei]|uniref:Lysophospholipase L1-like esterase n=1 Tax=Paucimonas lemoignei TaxID=29443 RepID=A0A4V2UIG4_PAULE|nr:SGNH/GDSL hydrolase family protein [Paucimonas lemoignei]TCS36010.1 lysophospholipase L1-like esterase [Paucimonas lemoignei]
MLSMYKYCLGPILLAQAKWLRTTALRLPEAAGPRSGVHAVEESVEAVRVLFVGDSSAAGVGVPNQTQALAYQAAERLSETLKINVHWQLIAKSGVNTKEALELAEKSDIHAADVLVTALGVNDVTSQRTPQQFIQDYQRLVDRLIERTGLRHVVVTGLPPLRILPAAPHPLRWYLGKYAAALDQSLKAWADSSANFRYVSLDWAAVPSEMAADKYHPGEGQYCRWAEMVAEDIANLIVAPRALQNEAR